MENLMLTNEKIEDIKRTIFSCIDVDFIYLLRKNGKLLIAYYSPDNTMNYLDRIVTRLNKIGIKPFWISDIADFDSEERFEIISGGELVHSFDLMHTGTISDFLLEDFEHQILERNLALSRLGQNINLYEQ